MRFAVLFGLCACGRLEFDDRPTALDAALDAAHTCDPTAPFGTPVPIAELDRPDVADGTLRLLPDELTGYFWSTRNGDTQIFRATRTDLDAPFTITPEPDLAVSGANVLDPTVSSDGTLIMYRRSKPGDDLYLATRTGPDTFTGIAMPAVLDSAFSDVQPFLQPGGDELYFSSTRTGAGDIYRAIRTGTTFSTPALVAELASTAEEGDPVIADNGLTLYFRSNRPPSLQFDIWTASRMTTADAFATPVRLPNVSGPTDDGPSWLSPDGCRMYISSDRAGTNDIYVATRGP